MEHIQVEEFPRLRDPIFILAFEGWNDAAQSATIAARFLVNRFDGKRFAWFQSDDFFQYSDQRPQVRLDTEGNRQITWPENAFFYCQHPELSRDLVVCIGVEPQLKWKAFSQEVLELVRKCGTTLAVTMGGLLAGHSHKDPLELVCLATEPELAARTGVETTKYEGPTGIVGVIHTRLQDALMPAVSIWVNIPQYIASLPNPKGAYALLERLSAVGEFRMDLSELERSADQFDSQVEEAIEERPEIARFFSRGRLGEDASDEPKEDEPSGRKIPEDLPSGEELADEIESYLRRRKNGEESD